MEDLIKCGVGDIIVKILIDAKGFYDYDQRETGGISEEEFEEMEIGGYSSIPSAPPMEHPNSARSTKGSSAGDASTVGGASAPSLQSSEGDKNSPNSKENEKSEEKKDDSKGDPQSSPPGTEAPKI